MADVNLLGARKVQGGTVKAVRGADAEPAAHAVDKLSVAEGGVEKGIRVEKIENGFLLTETVYGNGDYKEKKTFSETKPDINVQVK